MPTHFTRRLLASVLSVVVLVEPVSVLAATRTWDAGGTDNRWSTAANWSSDTVPTATDIALFDGTGKKDATIDAAFAGTGAELRMAAANTGTITVGRSLTINGNISLSGGTFRINGGNTVTVKGSWQNGGGTFTSNTGTVLFTGSGTSYVLKETGTFKHLSLDDGLLGYYRFNEMSETTAVDSSRYGNLATLQNGTTPSTDIPPLSFENVRSLYFDGVNDYVEIVGNATNTVYSIQSSDFTAALWLKLPLTPSGTFLLGHAGAGQAQGFRVIHIGDGILRFRNANSSTATVLDTTAVNDNAWHHFIFRRNGNTLSIYKDGVFHASTTTAITNIDTSSAFHLGAGQSHVEA